MTRVCLTCALEPERRAALERRALLGEPVEVLGREYGVSGHSLRRHLEHAMPDLADTIAAQRLAAREGVVDAIGAHVARLERWCEQLWDEGHTQQAVQCAGQLTRAYLVLAKIAQFVTAGGDTINVGILAHVEEARRVLALIEPALDPAARIRAAAALLSLSETHASSNGDDH